MEGLTLALVPLLLIVGTTGDTVRFGVILEDQNPSEPYSYGHVGPAVELAVQRINREGWLGPHRLMAQYQKITKMSQYTALTVAMGMYENDSGNLDFFLGPTSEYLAQTVIRLAAFWKVPVMTCSIVWRLGVKGDPRDDGNYETVVRTVPTSGDLGKLVLRLYQEYDWTRGFQLYHKGNDDDSCYFLQSGIWSEWHIVNEERDLEPLTHESIGEFSQDEFNLTDPAGRREMDKRFADELERVRAVSRDDPRLMYSLSRVAPAIQLAVKVVNSRGSLGSLPLVPRFVRHLRCETFSMQVGAMAMYYDHKTGHDTQHHCSKDRKRPSILLGPSCDFPAASIVRLASYWNIPFMTVAVPMALQNRREDAYKTGIRTSVSSGEVGRFALRVLAKFKWTRTFSVVSHGGGPGNHTCYFLVRGIYDEWRVREGVHVQANVFEFEEDNFDLKSQEGLSRLDEKLRSMMTEAKTKARVIITCASAPYVWRLMKVAREMGMTNGDYVFLIVDVFDHAYLQPDTWIGSEDNQQERRDILDAFRAAFVITVPRPDTPAFREFSEQVREIGKQNFGFDSGETLANPFVESYFNDVLLYATALNGTPGYNYTNGTEMALKMRNVSFIGADGEEVVVKNGDRVFNFLVLDLNRSSERFVPALFYNGSSQNFTNMTKIDWIIDRPMVEPPACVWNNTCPGGKNDLAIALRSEQEKLVQWEDIQMDEGRAGEGSVYRMQVAPADPGDMQKWHSRLTLGGVQVFATTGIYKGKRVVIKDADCDKSAINLTDDILLELKRMRDLAHDHVVRFVGVCFKSPRVFILTEYCLRGSLQDTLENEEIHLDIEFQCSLMHDIVKGMGYLQSSEVHYHGNLKSSNCVVDSRFVVKLTDFGLPTFRAPLNKPPQGESCYRKKLWTAPEMLRELKSDELTLHAIHKADVYSFGIIMQEIVQRQGPFYMADDPNASAQGKYIVEKVKLGSQTNGRYYRPDVPVIDDSRYGKALQTLMQQCWEEDPNLRPEFGSIRTQMRQIDRGRNLMDTLLSRLEQYASNLEEMVQERTEELAVEKKIRRASLPDAA
ncbi:hypothetical protein Bbelb_189270 [Branchiostoma belcheri]|nr:hypothetical protein Bbelb_189270 [Branchiostoma belcheri]